jgi:hypothetical protein
MRQSARGWIMPEADILSLLRLTDFCRRVLTRPRPTPDLLCPAMTSLQAAALSLRRTMVIGLRLFRTRKETPPPVPAREPWR